MTTSTLAGVLLATTAVAGSVEPRLELVADQGRLNLRLCFSSATPHRIGFHLEVSTLGQAGTSRSRQSGELVSGPSLQCPLNNRFGLAADSRVEATVTWTVDDVEQPPLHQTYPAI